MNTIIAITRTETLNSYESWEEKDSSDVLYGLLETDQVKILFDSCSCEIQDRINNDYNINWVDTLNISKTIKKDKKILGQLTDCKIHLYKDNDYQLIALCLDKIKVPVNFLNGTSIDFNKLGNSINQILNTCGISTSAGEFTLYLHDKELGYNNDVVVRYNNETKEVGWQNQLPLFNNIYIFQHVRGRYRIYDSLLSKSFHPILAKIKSVEDDNNHTNLYEKFLAIKQSLSIK